VVNEDPAKYLLEDARAHLEHDGGRYLPPFLLWLEGDEVVLGHVAFGRIATSGAVPPGLAEAITAYEDLAAGVVPAAEHRDAARAALAWMRGRGARAS
jgi:hypothetical protein